MEPLFEIKEEKSQENYAKFVLSPLKEGYGYTLGNSLRRVLLSSLKGAAITNVKISGVKHQFSTLKGMKEDVLDFLLNLKRVSVSYDGDKPLKATLSARDAGEVKASDIKISGDAKIANPDLVLANLSKGAKLDVEMEIKSGVGYLSADERDEDKAIGIIPLDASFSPVLRVSYKVEETRVGRVTNYDKLTVEIWTDGTIEPEFALRSAAEILVAYFNQIVNPKKVEKKESEIKDDGLGMVGKLSVEEIGLPTRVANALSKAGYETVEKLVKADPSELTKVRNLGDKSIKIINAALKEKGVEFNA